MLAVVSFSRGDSKAALIGSWEKPTGIGIDREPESAPSYLYLYWGSTTNRRFTGSGEHVRHIFHMGSIQGGEWRDPKFLRKLDGGMFRAMSQICCKTVLFPPLEWDFPVYSTNKIEAQQIRAFVANGNSMVFTGGIPDIEFINRYFFYDIEPADGNFSPGPFRRLPSLRALTDKQLSAISKATKILPQIGTSVTAVKKDSLPSGTQILYATPRNAAVFLIKFCMAEDPLSEPAAPLPPIKVLPRDCAASKAAGRPCSCGNLCYAGYNWNDRYPSRWDGTLKALVETCSAVPPENSDPALAKALAPSPAAPAAKPPAPAPAAAAKPPAPAPATAAKPPAPAPVAAKPPAAAAKPPAPAPAKRAAAAAAGGGDTAKLAAEVAKAVVSALKDSGLAAPAGRAVDAGRAAARAPAGAAVGDDCLDCGAADAGGEVDRERGGCGPLCRLDRLVRRLRSA